MSLQGMLQPGGAALAEWIGRGVPSQMLQPRGLLPLVQPEWVGEQQGEPHWKWGPQGVLLGRVGLQWGRVGWLQSSWAAWAGRVGVWQALEQQPQQQMRLQIRC